MSRDTCPVCGIHWGYRAACESPACPVVGLPMGSDAAERAALRWRSRHSVASARTWSGDDALAALEAQSWLDMQEAAGELIDIEISHGTR